MKAVIKQALADCGVVTSKYVIHYDGVVLASGNDHAGDDIFVPEIWGVKLEKGTSALYVEYQCDQWGGKPRYYLRSKQGDNNSTLSSHRTQREAFAEAIRFWLASGRY